MIGRVAFEQTSGLLESTLHSQNQSGDVWLSSHLAKINRTISTSNCQTQFLWILQLLSWSWPWTRGLVKRIKVSHQLSQSQLIEILWWEECWEYTNAHKPQWTKAILQHELWTLFQCSSTTMSQTDKALQKRITNWFYKLLTHRVYLVFHRTELSSLKLWFFHYCIRMQVSK